MSRIKTHPLKTPRTRLSIKNDPITMSGMKNTQLKALPRASLVCKALNVSMNVTMVVCMNVTQYMMGVQPSIVTH